MSKREPSVLLDDMRTSIGKIKRYIADLDEASFLADDKTIDAVVRNLEIIGEAAKQLPTNSRRSTRRLPGRKLLACAIALCMTTQGSI
jgi:uncharacterized protein with HEPN domain